jgi:predicted ATPase
MKLSAQNLYLRALRLDREKIADFSPYPFCLPAINSLYEMEFHPAVTFIVGENGSGKSTILEAIAIAYGFNPEGGTKNFTFATKDSHSILHNYIKLIKGIKMARDGFFLRAESFYNLATNIEELDQSRGGKCLIDAYGGLSLHAQSHGESFWSVFMHRFAGQGLYILDEPEAALSPARQMAMLARMHDLVNLQSQFIIATHSPIIMAYPEAVIFQMEDGPKMVEYKDTEHYQITREFLNNPEKILRILME